MFCVGTTISSYILSQLHAFCSWSSISFYVMYPSILFHAVFLIFIIPFCVSWYIFPLQHKCRQLASSPVCFLQAGLFDSVKQECAHWYISKYERKQVKHAICERGVKEQIGIQICQHTLLKKYWLVLKWVYNHH